MAAAQGTEGFRDDQAAYISGTLLEAGSDTTSSILYGFVQAMVLFPEVQKKAQEQLDRVIGKDRLEDMDSLQYIRGCMKESLRFMPTTLTGVVPHAATKGDEYMGYLILKGAGFLNNVYAIHHDPKRFPDPRRFDPDRYKDDRQSLYEAASNPDASKWDTFTLVQVEGYTLACMLQRSLFLDISRMLWAFDISPAVDQTTSKALMADPEKLTQGFVCMPELYPAAITLRSPVYQREWS